MVDEFKHTHMCFEILSILIEHFPDIHIHKHIHKYVYIHTDIHIHTSIYLCKCLLYPLIKSVRNIFSLIHQAFVGSAKVELKIELYHVSLMQLDYTLTRRRKFKRNLHLGTVLLLHYYSSA